MVYNPARLIPQVHTGDPNTHAPGKSGGIQTHNVGSKPTPYTSHPIPQVGTKTERYNMFHIFLHGLEHTATWIFNQQPKI